MSTRNLDKLMAPASVVAIGASNTHGWYVGNQGAYPAQLQALLQARGIDAQVTNAEVPFDTTWKMLRRIDTDVPNGTDIVIVQPGTNDLRFFGTMQQRAANVAEMAQRLRARSIKVIVYDEKIPLRTFDRENIDQIDLKKAESTWYGTQTDFESEYSKLWGVG